MLCFFHLCKTSGLHEALQTENHIREKYSSSSDILYSPEDLQGELTKLSQGRRLQLTLGGQGCSVFSYRAVVLDAEEQSDPFTYHCGVFIVPKVRLTLGRDPFFHQVKTSLIT